MRVVLVHRDLHAITRGGIGTVYRALAPRLRRSGHQVTLLTQETAHPPTDLGIPVQFLPRTEDLARHRYAAAAALDALAPDVVESSSWEAETLTYLTRPRTDRAPVLIRGDLSARTMRASHLVAAERDLLRAADAVVAVSEFAADDLAEAYRVPRPGVIANGVDRDRFRPGAPTAPTGGHRIALAPDASPASRQPLVGSHRALPPPWVAGDGRPRLVWVGKTTPMKGWDLLEDLAVTLVARVHLTVLLGRAPALCPVRLTGAHDDIVGGAVPILQDLPEHDMPSFLSAADYLLCTSRWEGFGLAVAEALAVGTPALLPAALGTARELLADDGGHTYRDHRELLALLDEPARPSGVLPRHFDWDTAVAATLTQYRALTDPGNGAR